MAKTPFPLSMGTVFDLGSPRGKESKETTGDVQDFLCQSFVNSARGSDAYKWAALTSVTAACFDSIARNIARGHDFHVKAVVHDVLYAMMVHAAKNGIMVYAGSKAHVDRIRAYPDGTPGGDCPIWEVKHKAALDYVSGKVLWNGNVMLPSFTMKDRFRDPKYEDAKAVALTTFFISIRKSAYFVVDKLHPHHRAKLAQRNGRPFSRVDHNEHCKVVRESLGGTWAEIESRIRLGQPKRSPETNVVKIIKDLARRKGLTAAEAKELARHFNNEHAHCLGKIKA